MPDRLNSLYVALRTRVAAEAGQGLTEYALILALVAIVAMLALTLIGGNTSSQIHAAGNGI